MISVATENEIKDALEEILKNRKLDVVIRVINGRVSIIDEKDLEEEYGCDDIIECDCAYETIEVECPECNHEFTESLTDHLI